MKNSAKMLTAIFLKYMQHIKSITFGIVRGIQSLFQTTYSDVSIFTYSCKFAEIRQISHYSHLPADRRGWGFEIVLHPPWYNSMFLAYVYFSHTHFITPSATKRHPRKRVSK